MATTPLNPNIWVYWRQTIVGDDPVEYHFAFQPLADPIWKEPRLLSLSSIERRLSSDDGDTHSPSVTAQFDDSDGFFRALLADTSMRHGIGGEAAALIVSETARKAGTSTGDDLFRGRVTDLQAPGGRIATMTIEGAVAKFAGIDMNKTFPNATIGAEQKNAPETSVGLVYPLIIGEHADLNATDLRGNSVEKGMLPAIDVGDYLFLADGTEVDTDDYPIPYLDVPSNIDATVNGTPGESTILYEITALSDYGETTAGSVTVTTGPDLLNGTDSVTLTWDAVDGAIGYHVYRNHRRIALLNNSGSWTDPEDTYDDIGTQASGPAPPTSNYAATSVMTDDGEAVPRTRFIAMGKAGHVEYVYASDLGDGVAPKRTRLGASNIGVDLWLPGEPGWPHATEYVDFTRPDGTVIRATCFYMIGARVQHHRDKVVTIAWSGWGVEDVGDLTGDPIIQAFPALQWLANEEWLKNDGAGYLTGTYGPGETFANGVSKLKSSKFMAAQNLTRQFLGTDTGYIINCAITEPITVQAFLRRFHQTFGSFDATSRFGQFYPVLIDDISIANALSNGLSPLQDENTMSGNLGDETLDDAPPDGAYELLTDEQRAYRDQIEIIRWGGQPITYGGAITKQLYDLSWDADAQRFRLPDQKVEYDYLAYGYTEPKTKAKRLCYYTHDDDTARDATDRFVRRNLVPRRQMSFVVDLMGLEDDLGSEVLLTHYEGAGGASGDVNTRGLVIASVVNPMAPEEVTLTVVDLSRVVVNTLSPLQNENEMSVGNLGDETSHEAPPTGAEVLM